MTVYSLTYAIFGKSRKLLAYLLAYGLVAGAIAGVCVTRKTVEISWLQREHTYFQAL